MYEISVDLTKPIGEIFSRILEIQNLKMLRYNAPPYPTETIKVERVPLVLIRR